MDLPAPVPRPEQTDRLARREKYPRPDATEPPAIRGQSEIDRLGTGIDQQAECMRLIFADQTGELS